MEPESEEEHSARYSCMKRWLKIRYLIVALLSSVDFVSNLNQIAVVYAIVAMAAPLPASNATNSADLEECPQHNSSSTAPSTVGALNWNEWEQTAVVNAALLGSAFSQIPAGFLSERLNLKILIAVVILGTSFLSIISPVTAYWNVEALIAVQTLVGFLGAAIFPPSITLIARWIPRQERTTMVALVGIGGTLAAIIGPLVITQLCQYGFAGGWPSVFYVSGILGVVWILLWLLLAKNHPEEHSYIMPQELHYILQNREVTRTESMPLPLKKMMTSIPIWALCTSSVCISWPQSMFLAELPSYMKSPLNYSIQDVGYLSTAVNIGQAVLVLIGSILSDRLLACNVLPRTYMRKIFIIAGGIGTAISIALMPEAGCSRIWVTVAALLCTGTCSTNLTILSTTSMELAPNLAGAVSGLWNFSSSIASFTVPFAVASVIGEKGTLYRWAKIYYIGAGINVVGMLIYLFFGSARPQPWSMSPTETEESTLPATSNDKTTMN